MTSLLLPLQTLRKQHHALYPPFLLDFADPASLAQLPAQQWLVDHILFDPAIRGFEPERSYSRSFWRKVVLALEMGVGILLDGDRDCVGSPCI